MNDPTICPRHNFSYRICNACKTVFCTKCLPPMKMSTSSSGTFCPSCGGSARAANNYEVERHGVSHFS